MKLASCLGRDHFMRSLLFAIPALALLAASAQAQPARSLITDELVRGMLSRALDGIDQALCANERCASAAAAEKSNPPVSVPEARAVVVRGILAGFAENCGLNWRQRSFQPMMQYWRQTMKKSERQLALIGVLHGVAVGTVKPSECSARQRENIDRQLTLELDLMGRPKKPKQKFLVIADLA
jgi:hypothetical protein